MPGYICDVLEKEKEFTRRKNGELFLYPFPKEIKY